MNGHMDEPSVPTLSSPLGRRKLDNQTRFETELEFVQCLANPHYLASLATQGLLAQPNFVAYLKYLTYWLDASKGFSRFIVYPHALHHLALLQEPSFREALKDPELRMRLEREQYLHWRTWRTNEPTSIPTNGHLHAPVEETDAPTPRVTRRSGTARSSGARTPAGRTPKSVRTPGTVRTPGFGARTPAPKSALSVSVTAINHLEDIGIAGGNLSKPGPTIGNRPMSSADPTSEKASAEEQMVLDSPIDINANGAPSIVQMMVETAQPLPNPSATGAAETSTAGS